MPSRSGLLLTLHVDFITPICYACYASITDWGDESEIMGTARSRLPSTPRRPLPPRWDEFLNALTGRLSKPTTSLLSTRCLTRQTLSQLFMEIREALGLPTTFPAGPEIIEHLSAMGLASPLSVEFPRKSPHTSPSKEFVLFGIQESREIDPLEVLQSYNQEGVICYFSALAYFDLTTQVPTHQHVATLTRPTQYTSLRERESAPLASINDGPKRSKLGTHIFSYDDVPYFSVKRSITSVPGIQTRVISSRSNIRITTKEQTLLDTLHYPIHCGGMGVTFEAWNLSKKNINYDSICDYLASIQIDPLIRRLGAILDLIDCVPSKNLSLFLEQSKERIFSFLDVPHIPLLRGIDFRKVDNNWKVLIP